MAVELVAAQQTYGLGVLGPKAFEWADVRPIKKHAMVWLCTLGLYNKQGETMHNSCNQSRKRTPVES